MSPRVTDLLDAVRRRLRVAWANETGQLVAPWIAGAAVVLVVLARFLPWRWLEPSALVIGLAAVVTIGAASVAQRVPAMVVARAADRGLQTRDAFASALQFTPVTDRLTPGIDRFTAHIHERADSLAAGARAVDVVPFHLHGRRVLVAVGLPVIVGVGDGGVFGGGRAAVLGVVDPAVVIPCQHSASLAKPDSIFVTHVTFVAIALVGSLPVTQGA